MRSRAPTASSSIDVPQRESSPPRGLPRGAGTAPRWSSRIWSAGPRSTASDLGYTEVTHTVEIFGVAPTAALDGTAPAAQRPGE